jgi:xanthine dehydrogenase small subunit
MTLLDFVRYEQRLTGTKIGCREGDCGACSVLVGTLKPDNTIEYHSITSCISPLGNAQGKHIVTVEGTNLKNDLTISQKAMKNNYATQCGFCTPGFVVSLTGFCLSDTEKKQDNALNAISGNICRCTGYKSIEKAANEVCNQLGDKKENTSTEWLVENKFIPAYFKDIPKRLSALKQEKSIEQNNIFVSGGTDLYVQKADRLSEHPIYLISEDEKLKGISIKNDVCTIGAGNVVSDLWNHPELNSYFPNLKKHLKLVSSEQIRNMASLGGNFVNASPIGDMTVFFLALNSNITIVDKNENERTIALKNFYKNYKVYDLNEDELLKSIHFKLPTKTSFFNFEKVCKRTHLDIASVNSAIHIITDNQIIKEVHISMGGVAAIPKYLVNTVAFLEGKTLHPELIIEANKILQKEIAAISDVIGASDYKRLLARQLFSAHFTELFPTIFTLKNVIQHA